MFFKQSDEKAYKTLQEKALKFLRSVRGQYIVGQALYLAIESIEARPPIQQEPSNVADMKFLMDYLFPIYASVAEANKAMEKANKAMEKAKKPA